MYEANIAGDIDIEDVLAGLYKSPTRFIFELLQNAEDVLLLASSSEASVLRRRRVDFSYSNIAYPCADEVLFTEVPFVGLQGAAHMLQKLWNAYITKAIKEQVDK